MKISIGKLSAEKNGVELKWDGMVIEGSVEETIESYKYMQKMLPELKEMFMRSVGELKAYQSEEARMRRDSHRMDVELENLRHQNRMQEMGLSATNDLPTDDDWMEDDDDDEDDAEDWITKANRKYEERCKKEPYKPEVAKATNRSRKK